MKLQSNIYGALVPHAPTLLEDELDNNNSSVITALKNMGKKMTTWGVDVIIAATTHWQTERKFFIDNSPSHHTVMDYFGFRKEIEYDVAGYPELARLIQEAGNNNLIFPEFQKHGVDHAITIPLHFMFPERSVPVIPLSISGTPLCAFRWGRTIGNVLREWGGKVLFMASGSLPHNLSFYSSGKMQPEQEVFDRKVLELLSAGKGMNILEIDSKLIHTAKPEGAFRDLFMLMGVMGSQSRGQIQAYEKLPGVGMGVIEFSELGYNAKDEKLLEINNHNGILH